MSKKNKIKLINGTVLENLNIEDQKVFIGLRPEFFVVSNDGQIEAEVEILEHVGRDTMIICKLEGYDRTIRAIVSSDIVYE